MFLGKPNSHIILALDTESKAEAIKVLDQTHDLIDVIKFNYPLILKKVYLLFRKSNKGMV